MLMNLKSGALLVLLGFAAAPAFAQDYPAKPIHIVVAFAAGSTTDIVARVAGQKLSELLGQTVVVENRGGAGGNLGAQMVAKAAPDGYTILATGNALAVNVTLYKEPGFSAQDLLPLIRAGETPNLIFVHPSVPANNLQELFALSRTREMSYASAGTGTGTQLMMELLIQQARAEIVHVPFSPATAVTAVVGDQVAVGILPIPLPLTQVEAGKLRPIAVTTPERLRYLPNVPTVAESGFPGFVDTSWFALFVPTATPSGIVARLNTELNRGLELAEVKEKFTEINIEFSRNSTAEVGEYVRKEIAKYAKVIEETGAKRQ